MKEKTETRPPVQRFFLLTLLSSLFFLGLSFSSNSASAQQRTPPKIIELEAMVIEGKVAKPQVFYVLGRSRVDYENLKLHRSFVKRIVNTAKSNPF